MVFDMHFSSLRTANPRTLWEDDVRPHYVTRRYAEFAASLLHLNVNYGDGQVGILIILVACFDWSDAWSNSLMKFWFRVIKVMQNDTNLLSKLIFMRWDMQLDLNLERLRVAVDDLLVKLARMFRKQKQQTIFLINNYDLVLSVLKVSLRMKYIPSVSSLTILRWLSVVGMVTEIYWCLWVSFRKLVQMVVEHSSSSRSYLKVAQQCSWYGLPQRSSLF